MLKALNIKNFALVAELDIELGPGLTVITGESGAGKSILLDALSLVLGARVKRSQLRPGANGCDVSAEFDIDHSPDVRANLEAKALDDGNACLVRRTAAEGRSRAFVNSVPATLDTLRSLTEPLIDIHGQHEYRQLLAHDVQRRLLDEFGVAPALLDEVRRAFVERADRRRELAELRANVARTRERRALLRYQIDELDGLGDSIRRVSELTATHRRLSRAREWTEIVGQAIAELDHQLVDQTGRLAGTLERVEDDHAQLKSALELTLSAQANLEEALAELRRYLDAFPNDDAELAEADEALAAIHDLARKHGVRAENLSDHLATLQAEFESLAGDESRIDELARACEEADARFRTAGTALSDARRRAAATFAERVRSTIAELGLPDAEFTVVFEPAESAAGLESVAFRVTTNPRFAAGDLADIASGGELSRFALAIEVVAAESSQLPCLILDEADIGVGGTTADVIGRMLQRLARNTQVIAITHAPQVAALGDTHLRVSKTSEQDTVIERLDDAERTEELARMLGGRSVTAESRSYARTLLADAQVGVTSAPHQDRSPC